MFWKLRANISLLSVPSTLNGCPIEILLKKKNARTRTTSFA